MCKIFGRKIKSCNFFDKSQVCWKYKWVVTNWLNTQTIMYVLIELHNKPHITNNVKKFSPEINDELKDHTGTIVHIFHLPLAVQQPSPGVTKHQWKWMQFSSEPSSWPSCNSFVDPPSFGRVSSLYPSSDNAWAIILTFWRSDENLSKFINDCMACQS